MRGKLLLLVLPLAAAVFACNKPAMADDIAPPTLQPLPPIAPVAYENGPPPGQPVPSQPSSPAPLSSATAGTGNPNQAPSDKSDKQQSGDKKDDKSADSDEKKPDEPTEQRFNIYGQTTVIGDWNGTFRSPYSGPHSFQSVNESAVSETGTLFMGLRVLPNTEVYFNPEIAGGRGLSNVFGIAAFPNGDVTRVGNLEPTPYVARLYVEQTIGLGGEQEKLDAGPNQLGEMKDVSRLTFAAGKLATTDWFDKNKYSDDPRSQFMNWALMYNAAYDFPADVRGYTYGGVVELNQEAWALRYGIFAEPTTANGPDLDADIGRVRGQVVEFEKRYKLCDHPGIMRAMFYWNRANMGNYNEAIENPAADLNIANTQSNSMKYGFGINFEQEFSKDLGGFLRLGWNDGHTETWAFTECDRTCAFGLVLKGTSWCRGDDTVGTGVALDGISGPHAAYLAAGGLGFELGDGTLDDDPEIAWETYYSFKFKNHSIWITPDVQLIADPGYNGDRGPVVIGAVRLHAEF